MAVGSLSLLTACGATQEGDGDAAAPTTDASLGAAAAADPLKFVAWEQNPERIQAHLDEYTERTGVPMSLEIIPNVGYTAALQTKLQGGEQPDVFYNFTYSTQKFVEEGWARTLDGLPGLDEVMADMFPASRPHYTNASDEIISLPYFSAVHLLHYNERLVSEAGFGGPPETLDDLFAQCEKLKADGLAEHPYAAYWTKQFCEEYLMVYLLAEGVQPLSAAGEPVFADDAQSERVLEWWQSMYQDELASPTMLTDDPNTLSLSMASGRAAFFTLHHYFLKTIRDLEGEESENVVFSYRHPGSAGTNFQMGEVLQMGPHLSGENEANAWDLMKFYGWRDDEGEFTVFRSWAEAAALLAPYPDFFADPGVREVFPDYYDMDALSDVFENNSNIVPGRNASWYSGFNAVVGDRIHALLLGEATPRETVNGLADDALQLAREA